MHIKRAFGMALATARKEKGLSQEQLAFDVGVARSFVSRMERGVHMPNLEKVFAIAEVLGIPAWELIHMTEAIIAQRQTTERVKKEGLN